VVPGISNAHRSGCLWYRHEPNATLAKITKFDRDNRKITVDVVQFLTGHAAKKAYQEDTGGEPDTDYYVRNQSKELRTFPLADDAEFRVTTYLGGYSEKGFNALLWISLEDGVATHVEEQYVP
jgi:hypothetical protein